MNYHLVPTFVCLLFAAIGCNPTLAKAAEQPNILLILADDLGFEDVGFQNSPDILSPNLDRLAESAVRFTDGHTTASVCSPSRAGLITGRYQQRFGHESNVPPTPHGMDLKEVTLAEKLKQANYRTGIVGKWHLGNLDSQYPTSRGFDYFFGLREGSRSYFYSAKKDDKPGNHHGIEENGKQVVFEAQKQTADDNRKKQVGSKSHPLGNDAGCDGHRRGTEHHLKQEYGCRPVCVGHVRENEAAPTNQTVQRITEHEGVTKQPEQSAANAEINDILDSDVDTVL
jgi:hypothetical protein